MSETDNSVNVNFGGGRYAFDDSEIAEPLRRVGGFLIDAVIAAVVTSAIAYFIWKSQITWLNRFFFWVFGMWLWDSIWITTSGTTPGKKILGVSIYSPKTDGIPEPTQVGLRMIGFWLGFFMMGLGLTPILMRKDRRGWADTLSETLTFGPSSDGVERTPKLGGGILYFVQTLASIAFLGALFATLTIHVWTPVDPNETKFTSSQCENPALLVKNPQEVLFAITVSPAWADCWRKTHFTMGTLKDSQVYQLAQTATEFHWVWTHNSSQWETLFKEVNHRIQTAANLRNPSGNIAAAPANGTVNGATTEAAAAPTSGNEVSESPLIKELNRRLESYNSFYKKFLQAKNRRERIDVLIEELKAPNHPIVTGALSERLWSEQLSEGVITAKFPEFSYKGWREEQICWLEYLEVPRPAPCNHGGFREAISKLRWLKENNTSVEEADYIKEDFDEESVPTDFFAAFDIWISMKKNDKGDLEQRWLRFPETSPLHRWAESLVAVVQK